MIGVYRGWDEIDRVARAIKATHPDSDAKIEGLVWHDLRATYGTRLGEAGFNAYDIAKLMGHANISTSQRYKRNLPTGAGEAVMLKNQRRHNTVTNDDSGALALVVKC
jgi:integrase